MAAAAFSTSSHLRDGPSVADIDDDDDEDEDDDDDDDPIGNLMDSAESLLA
jgi:hypothetical protein